MWTSMLMLGTSQKVCHSERGRGVDKWLKTDVAGNCAAINMISFSYNFLCLSLQLNFFIPILCVAPIMLQWNKKNSLKRPSQAWLWKGYMTSSKETISVKRIYTSCKLYSKLLVKAWVVTNLKKKTPKITVNP